MNVTTEPKKVPVTLEYKLEGRGLMVYVDASWSRADVAHRMTDLAADLLADVQSKAAAESDEATFLRAEAARTTLRFAARSCDGVAQSNGSAIPDPQPLTGVESPVDLVCEACHADVGKPCLDQRPGRNLRHMTGFHPERNEAYRLVVQVDARLRKLERAVAQGDESVLPALLRAQLRAGEIELEDVGARVNSRQGRRHGQQPTGKAA